ARDRGELVGASKKHGPIPHAPDPRDKKIAELTREAARWRRRAGRGGALVEGQTNSPGSWGRPSKPSTPDREGHRAWAAAWHPAHMGPPGRGPGGQPPATPATTGAATTTALTASPQS